MKYMYFKYILVYNFLIRGIICLVFYFLDNTHLKKTFSSTTILYALMNLPTLHTLRLCSRSWVCYTQARSLRVRLSDGFVSAQSPAIQPAVIQTLNIHYMGHMAHVSRCNIYRPVLQPQGRDLTAATSRTTCFIQHEMSSWNSSCLESSANVTLDGPLLHNDPPGSFTYTCYSRLAN